MLASLGLALHRAALRTERPLRPVWRLAHRAITRAAVAFLIRGHPGSTAYIRASFGYDDAIHGLSDIDLVIALPGAGSQHPCPRVRRRWARLCRLVPGLRHLVQPTVYERAELTAATSASTLTAEVAVHLVPDPACDDAGLRTRPGLFGPMRDWRHLTGPDLRPTVPAAQEAQERRIAAWLELQRWWREAFFACAHPPGPRLPHLCVKLVAEPARIWLWLVHGQAVRRRREVLEAALERMPEEREALTRALALHDALRRSPRAPLDEVLEPFVRLSARIARRLTHELEGVPVTPVRLVWGEEDELVLPRGAHDRLEDLGAGRPRFLPLADWRSRAWPARPDDALAPLDVDVTDPAALGAAARAAGDWGPYAAVRIDGLLVLPGPGVLRAVQCEPSDPVSFALLDCRETAQFPDAAGWSARDSARRAVAEHAAWLGLAAPAAGGPALALLDGHARTTLPAADVLARLFTSARAALFQESLEEGRPELALSLAAVSSRLAARGERARAAAEDGLAAYRAACGDDAPVPERLVGRLREAVLDLPAYAARSPWTPVPPLDA